MLAYDWRNLPDCEGIMLTEIIDPIACLLLLYMSISHASSVRKAAQRAWTICSEGKRKVVFLGTPAVAARTLELLVLCK